MGEEWRPCRAKPLGSQFRRVERREVVHVQQMDASVLERGRFEGTGLVMAEPGDCVVRGANGQLCLLSAEAFERGFEAPEGG